MTIQRKMPKPKDVLNHWLYKLAFDFGKYSFSDFVYYDKMPASKEKYLVIDTEKCLKEGICFACMADKTTLQRCHILPKCEGGEDSVENIHLLCIPCHLESEYLSGDLYWSWFLERHMVMSAIILKRIAWGHAIHSAKEKNQALYQKWIDFLELDKYNNKKKNKR